MQFIRLGRTDLTVSRVGLGTYAFGGFYGGVSPTTAAQIVQAALDVGVTLFETGSSYGPAEEFLTEALGSSRNRVIIVVQMCPCAATEGGERCGLREWIIRDVEVSLKRLQREYIDVYQIGTPEPWWSIQETMEVMQELRGSGKVRYVGFANPSTSILRDALKGGRIETVQATYNILQRSVEHEVLPFVRATRMGLLVCEVFGRGLLSGRFQMNSIFQEDDLRARDKRFRGEAFRMHVENVNRLRSLAGQEGLTLPQLALGWVFQNPVVAAAVCGATSPHHIRQAATATGIELTPEQSLAIDQILVSAHPV
jgi:aryl-alcohol dehydrogenase-like predicted oxidoreductase